MHNCNFTFERSALCTKPGCVKLRLRFLAFLVKMWLLKACLRLIFPLPVMVNLFFALDFVFILGITTFFLKVKHLYQLLYFFFELIIKIIFLPSNFGSCSITPKSASSCANFKRRISPRSLNTMVLPLKKTYAFTLLPSSKNFLA